MSGRHGDLAHETMSKRRQRFQLVPFSDTRWYCDLKEAMEPSQWRPAPTS